MGFIGDGESNELSEIMRQGEATLKWGAKLIFGLVIKPAIRNFKAARNQAALQHAALELQQQVQAQNQSPNSSLQNPADLPPNIAVADLSPPPRRKIGD